jgi:Fic family protein
MTPTRAEIEGLVLRIQGEFLNTPALRLTLGQVARRVGVSTSTCEAVLQALVEAGVLSISAEGYERFVPHRSARTRGPRSRAA